MFLFQDTFFTYINPTYEKLEKAISRNISVSLKKRKERKKKSTLLMIKTLFLLVLLRKCFGAGRLTIDFGTLTQGSGLGYKR